MGWRSCIHFHNSNNPFWVIDCMSGPSKYLMCLKPLSLPATVWAWCSVHYRYFRILSLRQRRQSPGASGSSLKLPQIHSATPTTVPAFCPHRWWEKADHYFHLKITKVSEFKTQRVSSLTLTFSISERYKVILLISFGTDFGGITEN